MPRYFKQPYRSNPASMAYGELLEYYEEMVAEAIPKVYANESNDRVNSILVMNRPENTKKSSNLSNRGPYRLDYEGLTSGPGEVYGRLSIQWGKGRGKHSVAGAAAQVNFQCGIVFTVNEIQHAFSISIEDRVICRVIGGEPPAG